MFISNEELPPDVLLNVNIPNLPQEQIKGIHITRQGTRVYRGRLSSREDPRHKTYTGSAATPPPASRRRAC